MEGYGEYAAKDKHLVNPKMEKVPVKPGHGKDRAHPGIDQKP